MGMRSMGFVDTGFPPSRLMCETGRGNDTVKVMSGLDDGTPTKVRGVPPIGVGNDKDRETHPASLRREVTERRMIREYYQG